MKSRCRRWRSLFQETQAGIVSEQGSVGWVEQRLALVGFPDGLASQDKAKPNSLNRSFFHRLDDIYVGSDAL